MTKKNKESKAPKGMIATKDLFIAKIGTCWESFEPGKVYRENHKNLDGAIIVKKEEDNLENQIFTDIFTKTKYSYREVLSSLTINHIIPIKTTEEFISLEVLKTVYEEINKNEKIEEEPNKKISNKSKLRTRRYID